MVLGGFKKFWVGLGVFPQIIFHLEVIPYAQEAEPIPKAMRKAITQPLHQNPL